MYKYQKSKASRKKQFQSIAALQSHLFSQLDNFKESSTPQKYEEHLFNEFEEQQALSTYQRPNNRNLLTKAKHITYSNKGKIEKMKREIRKLQDGQTADFVTGVPLFQRETPDYSHMHADQDSMVRELDRSKLTDLQELRRMIKKTQNNLKMYSQSVYKTQNKIVNAADKCGWQLDTGLTIKINKCNLDQRFKPKTVIKDSQKIRRRTMTSYNPRRPKLD